MQTEEELILEALERLLDASRDDDADEGPGKSERTVMLERMIAERTPQREDLSTREAIDAALEVLAGGEVHTELATKAARTLRMIFEQRGCKHYEGHDGLPETIDVIVFG